MLLIGLLVDSQNAIFGNTLFETKISDNVAIAEAPAHNIDIFRYAPTSTVAKDYMSLCEEIVQR